MSSPSRHPDPSTRRDFLKTSTATVVGGALGTLAAARSVHAAGSDVLKVGLVGCGGRGNGAAIQAVQADPHVQLTAMADLFEDRLSRGKSSLGSAGLGDKFAVDDSQCFVGFDAYQQLLKTDVDVVILATPPHFRPIHLKACIDAGKHVFCEKPVAVDAPGCRSVLETVQQAREKNLSIVSGLCWRYDQGVRETVQRIQDGEIGDILAIQENYLTGLLWHRARQLDWSEMEYQCRNWLYYTWLSGDHNVEQHVHSLDKAVWLMGDEPPAKCFGLGGRQVRSDEKWGNIFDHHAVCYEYANGVKVFAYTRQMAGCNNDVDDYVMGTKGNARILKFKIEGENPWRFRGDRPNMYEVEHQEMMAGLRSGNIINNGHYMTVSTMMAIMGRMACYTGQELTWDEALESQEELKPEAYEFGDVKIPSVAMPGLTKFV